jgi:predicted nucleotidyltransferase
MGSNMDIKDIKKKAEELAVKYKAAAVLLHGSYARGDALGSSDVDLLVVVEKDDRGFRDESFDIQIKPLKVFRPKLQYNWISPLASGVVLFQKKETGKKILTGAKKQYKFGPKKLSEKDIDDRRVKLSFMLERAESSLENPAECFSHLADFYLETINFYFSFRGLWTMSVRPALKYLKVNDKKFYTFLVVFSEAKSNKARLLQARKILEKI